MGIPLCSIRTNSLGVIPRSKRISALSGPKWTRNPIWIPIEVFFSILEKVTSSILGSKLYWSVGPEKTLKKGKSLKPSDIGASRRDCESERESKLVFK